MLELVLDDLRRNYPDLVDDAPRMLQSIAAKSGRYVAEMEEIAATQEAGGPDARSLRGARDRLPASSADTEAARWRPSRSIPSARSTTCSRSIDGG